MDLAATFERHSDEYIKFERIENPLHPRPDICAFLMLHELVPSKGDMVSAAEHDEIYLDVDCEKLAKVATETQLRDLHRCGVRYDASSECLAMFV